MWSRGKVTLRVHTWTGKIRGSNRKAAAGDREKETGRRRQGKRRQGKRKRRQDPEHHGGLTFQWRRNSYSFAARGKTQTL